MRLELDIEVGVPLKNDLHGHLFMCLTEIDVHRLITLELPHPCLLASVILAIVFMLSPTERR